jgi:hypothetical protein
MNTSIPEAIPANPPGVLEVLPVEGASVGPASVPAAGPSEPSGVLRAFSWLFGWAWRIGIGGLLCFNYLASVLVVGFLYRWMQGTVLRGWWKQSPQRQQGSFEDFCASLGHDAPIKRPRWFFKERMGPTLHRSGPDGRPPSPPRVMGRVIKLPFGSLWRNFKIGFLGLLATFILTGPGCLVMLFGWEFGWLVSFNKVYEQAFIGLGVSLLGIGLFIAAMFYVPMAQVHQAVTGDFRAFFDFRFVWRLIQARLTAYLGLVALTALLGLIVVEGVKIGSGSIGSIGEGPSQVEADGDAYTNLKLLAELHADAQLDPELLPNVKVLAKQLGVKPENAAAEAEIRRQAVLQPLTQYLMFGSYVLFLTLLLTRRVAAAIYRSAVVKVLNRGRVARHDLHPTLTRWFDALGLHIIPTAETTGFVTAVRWTGAWFYRKFVYTLIAAIWFAFVAKTYVGEFLNYHPIAGFGNHALIQFPCVDFVPSHLQSEDGAGSWFVKK